MSIAFRLRRLRRLPLLWWTCVVALAVVTGFIVSTSVARAQSSAAQLGGMIEVPVATHRVAVGSVLKPTDLTTDARPRAFLPKSPPVLQAGATVITDIDEGEVVTTAKVAPSGLNGPAALLNDKEVAITVPFDQASPRVVVGDWVDVIATLDPDGSIASKQDDSTSPKTAAASVVAKGARVVESSDKAAVVAVSNDIAPRVAFAAAKGITTLAVVRPHESE